MTIKFLLTTDPPVTIEDFEQLLSRLKWGFMTASEHVSYARGCQQINSELEWLLYNLAAISHDCLHIKVQGLQLKTDRTYATNDGYRLGSIVWKQLCNVEDYFLPVYGSTPEAVVINTIQLFTGHQKYQSNEQLQRQFLKSFEKALRSHANDWARYI